MKKSLPSRVGWIDLARGIAVILMIVFHIGFDLYFLEIYPVPYFQNGWLVLARVVQFTFLLTVGISLFLSYQRHAEGYLKRHLARALKLFTIALGITLVTWLFIPDAYVRFGILHLISVAILVGAPLVRYPWAAALLGVLIVWGTDAVMTIPLETSLLLPLGVVPPGFSTVDYFPLFPWLSLPLFGIPLATILNRWQLLKTHSFWPALKPLQTLGQHSLLIYLVHQPVLLAVLLLFFG